MATSDTNPFPTSDLGAGVAAEPAAAPLPPEDAAAKAADDLMERVVRSAHDAIDRLAATAAPHVRRLQDGVAGASEKLHDRADRARETGDEMTESLRCTVREHPLAAIATALAVGLLIARLTR